MSEKKYTDLSKAEIERVFAEDVLNLRSGDLYLGDPVWFEDDGHFVMTQDELSPLADLNHAMLGLKKVSCGWKMVGLTSTCFVELWDGGARARGSAPTPQEAIVEACIRIKRPDLFEEDSPNDKT